MNISEIKQLGDKDYVKGSVTGRISSTKNIEGKNMTLGKFGDDNDTIDLTAFGKDIRRFDGKEVTLSGMGMRKDSYNGYAKLSINERTKIDVLGESSEPQRAPSGRVVAQKPTVSLESVVEDMHTKLVAGFKMAEAVEMDLDGRIQLSDEDKRSIAISFVIEANRRGV